MCKLVLNVYGSYYYPSGLTNKARSGGGVGGGGGGVGGGGGG